MGNGARSIAHWHFRRLGAFAPHESAQSVSAYPLYAQARGEETIVSPAAASKFYTLYLDKTWDGDYSSYRAVLLDAAGTELVDLTG